jgi:hypothetical protein
MVRDNNFGHVGSDHVSGEDGALRHARPAGDLPRRGAVRSSLPAPRCQVVSPPNPDLLQAILDGLRRLDYRGGPR